MRHAKLLAVVAIFLVATASDLRADEPVTVQSFVRAETDHMIRANTKLLGLTVGKPSHNRQPTTPDEQAVIRSNQDTLRHRGQTRGYVVFQPGRFINDLDGLSAAVRHGSPWRYDTYVPVIFAGYGLEGRTVERRVHTVDVALTLSNLAGTLPPSGAAGGRHADGLALRNVPWVGGGRHAAAHRV
ncbi:MAG: hypothetical protein PVG98_00335 [Chromatiales bacterium]|jgi:hypothetical protein